MVEAGLKLCNLYFLKICSCFTSLSETWCEACELLVWLGRDATRLGMGGLVDMQLSWLCLAAVLGWFGLAA